MFVTNAAEFPPDPKLLHDIVNSASVWYAYQLNSGVASQGLVGFTPREYINDFDAVVAVQPTGKLHHYTFFVIKGHERLAAAIAGDVAPFSCAGMLVHRVAEVDALRKLVCGGTLR